MGKGHGNIQKKITEKIIKKTGFLMGFWLAGGAQGHVLRDSSELLEEEREEVGSSILYRL